MVAVVNVNRVLATSVFLIIYTRLFAFGFRARTIGKAAPSGNKLRAFSADEIGPLSPKQKAANDVDRLCKSTLSAILTSVIIKSGAAVANDEDVTASLAAGLTAESAAQAALASSNNDQNTTSLENFGNYRVPLNHVNLDVKQFLGPKATIVFNMKIDDPQTQLQFPNLLEIYKKYNKDGLNVLAFPSEQGWFEPDDDETIRAKSAEYYGFGDYPKCVVFDKVCVLHCVAGI